MNSHELNVNVPLATVESDSEEIEVIIKLFRSVRICYVYFVRNCNIVVYDKGLMFPFYKESLYMQKL
jgi:hypothetical protein